MTTPTIGFDPSAALLPGAGVESGALLGLAAKLDRVRDEICDVDEMMLAGEIAIPPSKQPLEGAFVSLPEQWLSAYEAGRAGSPVGQMLAVTKQLMTEVDRVVVLATDGLNSGPRALMAACCQPYFNELTRGQRGSRPRVYFAGDTLDNDAVQGLLHLLGHHRGRSATRVDERWGLVIMAKHDLSLATHCVLRPFWQALEKNCGGDLEQVRRRVIVVAASNSPLEKLSQQLGCTNLFVFPNRIGERFSVFSWIGLIPAALLGINVMKLLEGARTISRHFRSAKTADNLVLQYAAVKHLLELKYACQARQLTVWSRALEATDAWYQQLQAGSLQRPTPHREGFQLETAPALDASMADPDFAQRGCWINQIVVNRFRFDPLAIEAATEEAGLANPVASPPRVPPNTLVAVLELASGRMGDGWREAGRPSMSLRLPQVDEPSMGQLLQLLMLATVVQARLLGINPYAA